jgi:sialic acid synthase SpsE
MDHADGASDDATWLAVLAVPYGVSAIEKHLTLDRSLCLEDYQSAVAPDEFATFVRRLRIAEAAVGRPDLSLTAAETTYRRKALKPVIARQALTAGGQVVDGAVTLLRAPLESGRQPIFRIERALGRRVRNDVPIGRPLYEDDLA